MERYIYERHTGGFEVFNELIELDVLHHDCPRGCDYYVGPASNRKEAWDMLKDFLKHYKKEELEAFINANWEE